MILPFFYSGVMNLPRLYLQVGLQAQRDTQEVLRKHFQLLKLKEYCNVLDVGCGPGNITHDVLYPLLPKTINKLVGINISQKIIDFAKKNYMNSKIKFFEMDIVANLIPKNFEENFDCIFSFYCLHFVNDHKKALLNIHKMLKPRGTILLNFMSKFVLFNVGRNLSKTKEWQPYFSNLKTTETPSAFCIESRRKFESLLIETGFVPHVCRETKRMFSLYVQILIAVSFSNVPDHLQDVYILEYFKYLDDRNFVHIDENDKINFDAPYTMFTICATKI
ncbi:hypothetical protein FQA39_LY02382 [Lamprigera yunnana]|nr:hypothetical protein FQA39_LY02382 [Lamprigera yunnana]